MSPEAVISGAVSNGFAAELKRIRGVDGEGWGRITTPGENVEDHIGRMDALGQRLGALHGAANRAGHHRVFVVVKANKAGLRYCRRDRLESVEGADIGHEAGTFGLEHLPDRLVAHFRMRVRFRPFGAAVFQPGIEFGVAFELQTGSEPPAADDADLVLNLTLLPAR